MKFPSEKLPSFSRSGELMLEEERNLPVGEAPENQQGFSQRPTKAMS